MHRLHESLPLGRDPGDDLVGHVLAQEDWEVVRFPAIDQVDSTAQMLDWFKRGSGPSTNAGIFELYRQRAEELRRGQPMPSRQVRLPAPPRRRRGGSAAFGDPPERVSRWHGRDDRNRRRALLRAGWVTVGVQGSQG